MTKLKTEPLERNSTMDQTQTGNYFRPSVADGCDGRMDLQSAPCFSLGYNGGGTLELQWSRSNPLVRHLQPATLWGITEVALLHAIDLSKIFDFGYCNIKLS